MNIMIMFFEQKSCNTFLILINLSSELVFLPGNSWTGNSRDFPGNSSEVGNPGEKKIKSGIEEHYSELKAQLRGILNSILVNESNRHCGR